MYLPLCFTPHKIESYLEETKERLDAHMEHYKAQRRFSHLAWERHLIKADYFARRILQAEERLTELKEKNRITEPRNCVTLEENGLAFK